MNSPTREQVASALFTLLQTCGASFVTYTRRPDIFESFPNLPALALGQQDETYDRKNNTVTKAQITMGFDVWIYFDAKDKNVYPDIALNTLIDLIEDTITPPAGYVQTLGGLVYSCWIDKEIKRFPGYLNGQGGALMMVYAIVPQ